MADALQADEKNKDQECEDELWKSVFLNAPEIILIVNEDRNIEHINRAVEGIDIKDVIGSNVFDFVQEGYRDISKAKIDQVFSTGERVEFENKAVNAPNEYIWYRNMVSGIKKDGKISKIIIITSNIDALKRQTEELETLNKMMTNREIKMAELKQEVDRLKKKCGEAK